MSEQITPAMANEVLGVFFGELDRRGWSTYASEIAAAQMATVQRFRWQPVEEVQG